MAEGELAAVKGGSVIQEVQASEIARYLESTGLVSQLSEAERVQFVRLAQLYGLNPFKREIYCTVYGEGQYRKCSIVTGYEVYIKRAERTGKLDGWNVKVSGDGQVATITIWRKDWKQPFTHEVYFDEAVQKTYDRKSGQQRPNAVWQKMPKFMLKKVAIGQGFRLCFADEFGGMPYEESEMPQNERIIQAEASAVSGGEVRAEKPPLSPEAEAMRRGSDAAKAALKGMLSRYDEYLTAPKIKDALAELDWGDEDAVAAMGERVRAYLKKRGLEVA